MVKHGGEIACADLDQTCLASHIIVDTSMNPAAVGADVDDD